MITFRQAAEQDADIVAGFGLSLYSMDHASEDRSIESQQRLRFCLQSGKWAYFFALDGDMPIGVCEISLRGDYVEGAGGSTVGYIEGIFVRPEYRGRHIAKSLVALGEDWARERGCTEFASDCAFENADSRHFHLRIGFEEVGRNIHFLKKL